MLYRLPVRIPHKSDSLRIYYALQGLHNSRYVDNKLVPCISDEEKEQERLQWRSASTDPLPSSFRIGRDLPPFYRDHLAADIDRFVQEAANYKAGEDESEPAVQLVVHKLPFLEYAYQLSLDRSRLRKHPALKKIQTWLIEHDTEGHIFRQETVSMIPPVLLDVKNTDTVLDMCAAPGSKTTQIMEDDPALLIANDANHNRAYMLVHQLRRIMYHHPSTLVTTAKAQHFPSTILQFDKILCDVPCTGDGTPRKNIDVWKKWNVGGAHSLHFVQLQIAKRGVFKLLKVGGTLCYSTCSMNPIENEAVVAELLRSSNGALELVDCSDRLGSFRTRPGLSTWKVLFEDRPSSKDRKNYKKKNNAKMQARRKEYEESQRKTEAASSEATDTNLAESTNGKPLEVDEVMESPAVEEGSGQADGKDALNVDTEQDPKPPNHESAEKKKEPVQIFKPTTWDESVLLEDALKNGLMDFKSASEVPEAWKSRVRPTFFPPSREEAEKFHLERCVRCLSHDNNTGGFFVAILRKTGSMSSCDVGRDDVESPAREPTAKKAKVNSSPTHSRSLEAETINGSDLNDELKPQKIMGTDGFVKLEEGALTPLVSYFGLGSGFQEDLYYTRTKGEGKVFQYIAPPVKELFDLGIQSKVTGK